MKIIVNYLLIALGCAIKDMTLVSNAFIEIRICTGAVFVRMQAQQHFFTSWVGFHINLINILAKAYPFSLLIDKGGLMLKNLLVLVMMNSWTLLSAELSVTVRDVMDLATYHDVHREKIPLAKKKEVRSFIINDWKSCFGNCEAYAIQLKLEVKPLESEIVNDSAYIVAVIKELLFQGKVIKSLVKQSFIIMPGQEKITSDVYWGTKNLIVRQENVFSINR